MTVQEFAILASIDKHGPQSPGEVAHPAYLTTQAATASLYSMLNRGLVRPWRSGGRTVWGLGARAREVLDA